MEVILAIVVIFILIYLGVAQEARNRKRLKSFFDRDED